MKDSHAFVVMLLMFALAAALAAFIVYQSSSLVMDAMHA